MRPVLTRQTIAFWLGPVITLLTTAILTLLAQWDIKIPPLGIYTLLVVYATFSGGWKSGGFTAVLALVAIRLYLAGGNSPAGDEALRFWVSAVSMPLLILLVGNLKLQAEKAFAAEKQNSVLQAQLEERQRAERQLLLIRFMVDNAIEPIRIIDRSGAITYSNPNAQKVFGHQGEAPPNHKVWECDATFTPASWERHWEEVMRSGSKRYEITLSDQAGALLWLEMVDHHLQDGVHEFIISHGRDVTAQKLANSEIRRLNTELEARVRERTERLESINRELEAFTYSISHDLKAPLRGISGFARLIQEEYAGSMGGDCQHMMGQILSLAETMRAMIDDLLIYSRVERREITQHPVQIRQVVAELLAERQADLQAGAVETVIDLPFDEITADEEGMRLALRNLLDNAIKFSRDIRPACIEIGGRDDGPWRVLWVRDHGLGFDMKHHDRAFELFQRLHSAADYPGTGVGLSIVRKAMQRMGGRVYAQSEPGRGATFFLAFPRRAHAPAAPGG